MKINNKNRLTIFPTFMSGLFYRNFLSKIGGDVVRKKKFFRVTLSKGFIKNLGWI